MSEKNKTIKVPKIAKKLIKISILISLVLIFISIFKYLNSYYEVNTIGYFLYGPSEDMTLSIDSKGNAEFKPTNSKNNIGFIFYPGGRIDEKAYYNMASFCAYQDITTIIATMPFHLAVFNPNAADYIIENHPEITTWYIGGHSLGGSMAASYESKHSDKIQVVY